MRRMAFKMRLKPGAEDFYKKAHDEIWPELLELTKSCGIHNYSIFREGIDLFAVLELDETGALVGSENPHVKRWWEYLEPYMEYEPDGSPKTWPMVEVFHVD